jgi:hypothetical protein
MQGGLPVEVLIQVHLSGKLIKDNCGAEEAVVTI